eukprot:7596-Heterococcus_DN1.PRE.1
MPACDTQQEVDAAVIAESAAVCAQLIQRLSLIKNAVDNDNSAICTATKGLAELVLNTALQRLREGVARATAEAATTATAAAAATAGDTAISTAASSAVSSSVPSLEAAISCLLDGYHPLDTVHHALLLACCSSSTSSDEHAAAASTTAGSGAGDVSTDVTSGASQQLRPT